MSEQRFEIWDVDTALLDRLVAAAEDGGILYLTRAGRRVAAIVPAGIALAVEAAEDANDLEEAEAALAALESGEEHAVPIDDVRAEFGLDPSAR
jgi:antitoxin (DNA-binding transcriptional repressor) of toxin-antitoxin stability system